MKRNYLFFILLLFFCQIISAENIKSNFISSNAKEKVANAYRKAMLGAPGIYNSNLIFNDDGSLVNTTHVLDSMIFVSNVRNDITKHVFQWDKDGNVIVDENHKWDPIKNKWKRDRRFTYTIESDGKQYTHDFWGVDSITSEWLKSSRNVKIYDDNKNKLEESNYLWYGYWKEYDKFFYKYDDKGREILRDFYDYFYPTAYRSQRLITYDEKGNIASNIGYYPTGGIISGTKYTYEYDTFDRLITKQEDSYEKGSWKYITKYTYKYHEKNGKIVEQEIEIGLLGENLKKSERILYEYNEGGYQTLKENQIWFTDGYYTSDKYVNEYDSNGNCIVYEYYKIMSPSKLKSKISLKYDAVKNCVIKTDHNWDYDAVKWSDSGIESVIEFDDKERVISYESFVKLNADTSVYSNKEVYIYDTNDNLVQLDTYYWDKGTGSLTLTDHRKFYYSSKAPNIETSIEEKQIPENYAKAYFKDQTLVVESAENETISVYSVTGMKLYSTVKQEGLETINSQVLPKGILLVKGSSGWTTKIFNK